MTTTLSTPSPSAPPSAPPVSPAGNGNVLDQGGNAPGSEPPATPPNGTTLETPPAGTGEAPPADDWRARYAGEDTKRLEILSRYKTEADFANAFFEQRTALSKRAEPARLPENATPEQVAEWRKSLGLPEINGDAKPDAFMEAYKIAIPQGYEPSEFEKGVLGDFAKLAYEKGWSPAEVRGATDFFFEQQMAAQQAVNKDNVAKQQEWQNDLRRELGREYEPMVAAGEAYLNNMFADNPEMKDNILHAQLPGGGYLGDHPAFVKMVADLALQNGFTDRIEANSMESGGKSLEQQQNELEQLQFKDPARYNLPETQQKLNKIIELRLSRGEINEFGEPIRTRRSA